MVGNARRLRTIVSPRRAPGATSQPQPKESEMALLRQCLQELRVKRREWSASENFWGEADLPTGTQLSTASLVVQSHSAGVSSGVRWTGSSTASQASTLGI